MTKHQGDFRTMIYPKNKTVKLDEIKIRKNYTYPSLKKLIKHMKKFCETGKLDKLYLDVEGYLIDGYCDYLIAASLNMESVRCVILRTKVFSKEQEV